MESISEHFNKTAQNHDNNFINDMEMKPFYDEIESQLCKCTNKDNILVLGCGTGLEIERIKSKAKVVAVDISENMLEELRKKDLYKEIELSTICGSFLDMDFGESNYDIVLSCYAMHHFTADQKLSLYRKIFNCLNSGGVFINGDTMAKTREEELNRFKFAESIYAEQNKPFGSLHIDIPLCYEHEMEILYDVGFNNISLEREWTFTKLYRAGR